MKKYPEGFPLKPEDCNGKILNEGDNVKIILIPDWLYNGLEESAVKVIKSCKGKCMIIYEVDDYGYMWVEKPVLETDHEYESHRFSMEPKNLLKL